jgi:hypothetical protein
MSQFIFIVIFNFRFQKRSVETVPEQIANPRQMQDGRVSIFGQDEQDLQDLQDRKRIGSEIKAHRLVGCLSIGKSILLILFILSKTRPLLSFICMAPAKAKNRTQPRLTAQIPVLS